jgi:flagellar hook assembly protein FlgD
MGTIINDMGAYGGPNAIGWIYVSVEDEFFIEPVLCNLYQNYPNPFNPQTTISFSVAQTSSFVTLGIYNIKGQKIKTIVNQKLEQGLHQIIWDGKNDNNQYVASGFYFYKLKVNDKNIAIKKCLLLK